MPVTNKKSEMENPISKYPKPPFKSQSQPWPGLAGKMDPKPDHGESSYRGSNRLAGRKALITGGDSGMGRAPSVEIVLSGCCQGLGALQFHRPRGRVFENVEAH